MTTPATPTREVISFGPFSLGRMPGRTKHAGFLHFGGTAVAPNEVIGKSDLINQVGPALPWRKAASAFTSRTFGRCLATERTAPATPRRHRARLLLCGADFAGRTTLARMDFKNCQHHAERFVTIVGSGGVRQRWRSQSSTG